MSAEGISLCNVFSQFSISWRICVRDSLTLLLSVSFSQFSYQLLTFLFLFSYLFLSEQPLLSLCLAVSIVYALRSNLSPALVSVQGKLSPHFSNMHHNAVYQTHCKNAKSHTAPHITFKHLFLHTNMTFTIPISVSHFQSCSRQKPFADFFFLCVCVCVCVRVLVWLAANQQRYDCNQVKLKVDC